MSPDERETASAVQWLLGEGLTCGDNLNSMGCYEINAPKCGLVFPREPEENGVSAV